MEALLFVVDSMIFAVMVYMGLRDARRPAGKPATSLFRLRSTATAPPAATPGPRRRAR